MKTEQVNLRLEADLVAAIEEAARQESLDRGTVIRKMLWTALSQRRLDRALEQYQLGEISAGRAAEDARVTVWEIMEHARRRGIAHPLDAAEVDLRLQSMREHPPRVAESSAKYGASRSARMSGSETLPDRPPRPGGVLLVGINPAPTSVKAGHYYQGRIGKRLWRRLARLGLLTEIVPGREDDSFVRAGNGLTDVVKRSTPSARDLEPVEFQRGGEDLRQKVREWRPAIILFAFKQAAVQALGSDVAPGEGPRFEGIRTFLLSGPYASREESSRVDDQLVALLEHARSGTAEGAMTQPVTKVDIRAGRIRLRDAATKFFPADRGPVAIVIRGKRLTAAYNPRRGDAKGRSGVLGVGREVLARLVRPDERLRVARGSAGETTLD